jgi:hypothetical protein
MTAFESAIRHYDRGELRQALPLFQRALREQPEDVHVMYRAMLTLISMGDYKGCAEWLQQLIPHINATETPTWMMAGFYYNSGVAYEATGQWAKAEACHRSALTFDPDAILPKIEIGTNCYRQGHHLEGKRWHDQALIPETVDLESRPARSFLKLLRGDYVGGFREYEARWKLPQVIAKSHIPKAWRWKGKPLAGKKLLVVGEQGIGDTILMSRYIPLIEERGARVHLVINRGLVRLFKHNFPNVQITSLDEPMPQAQWWVPMMSLPYVFGTTKETIPTGGLRSDAAALHPIDSVLTRPLVGYVTNGNPLFMGDADRSAPAGAFTSLFGLMAHCSVHFYDMSEKADKERGFKDLADTAALVSQLDLVITVDTAIGHLAGALGVPCWLLPMTSLHWLWGMPEELTSPWYPKHTLYRRTSVDAWPEVIARVKADLINLAR